MLNKRNQYRRVYTGLFLIWNSRTGKVNLQITVIRSVIVCWVDGWVENGLQKLIDTFLY